MSFVIENVIPGDQCLEFISAGGRHLVVRLIGDCCSHSYFDADSSVEIRELLGDELLDIESNETMRETIDGNESRDRRIHYALIIRTNRRSLSLMWRNDSNGYYSGWTEISVDGRELDRWTDSDTVANNLAKAVS